MPTRGSQGNDKGEWAASEGVAAATVIANGAFVWPGHATTAALGGGGSDHLANTAAAVPLRPGQRCGSVMPALTAIHPGMLIKAGWWHSLQGLGAERFSYGTAGVAPCSCYPCACMQSTSAAAGAAGHGATDEERNKVAQEKYGKKYADLETNQKRSVAGTIGASHRQV
jgi:hypothetical protein